MAFTAVVGKELMGISYDPEQDGKAIMSTYSHSSQNETESETDIAESTGEDLSEFQDAVAEMKTSRPSMGEMFGDPDSDQPVNENMNGDNVRSTTKAEDDESTSEQETEKTSKLTENKTEPKRRFRDSLNANEIEEAKATGRAQLGLAFGKC
ncbi:MAG: hypothetical protein ACI8RD_006048 [Bacillariaceae sp.]|jgi:hypothetical protein